MRNLIASLGRRQPWLISARLTRRHVPLFLALLQPEPKLRNRVFCCRFIPFRASHPEIL